MAIVIGKDNARSGLLDEVERMSGVAIGGCLQCKKCSNGCPVAGLTKVSPSEILRRLLLNAGTPILESDIIWMCVSCEICYSRCPMRIDMASVMDALRTLSVRRGVPGRKGNVATFDMWFLKTVKMFGRAFDLGMIAAYKSATSSYFRDVEKFPMMLRKGKIALLPSFKSDKKYITRIFKK